jgi:6-pyruvoyltetrahydropterin/6-carboxytetrahydropterin synthase
MQVTSRYRFSAAHKLDCPAMTPEQNRALYGKCNNPYGHGHDYTIEVTVEGPQDAAGLVVNRAELDKLVRGTVVEKLDHKYLNEDVEEFRTQIPTTENLVDVIREDLRRVWSLSARLVRIRIIETPRNTFVWEAQ